MGGHISISCFLSLLSHRETHTYTHEQRHRKTTVVKEEDVFDPSHAETFEFSKEQRTPVSLQNFCLNKTPVHTSNRVLPSEVKLTASFDVDVSGSDLLHFHKSTILVAYPTINYNSKNASRMNQRFERRLGVLLRLRPLLLRLPPPFSLAVFLFCGFVAAPPPTAPIAWPS